ncbi:MAG: phosphoenolpyruvate synthase [Bacteroidetes bacterium]|nr:phosphoenolpyruvate synthase [Bacteroidota bacterium]
MVTAEKKYTYGFGEIGSKDVGLVGGKNASLGEMFSKLGGAHIRVPDGFVLSAQAYRDFVQVNGLQQQLDAALAKLDTVGYSNLAAVGADCRALLLQFELPEAVRQAIREGFQRMVSEYGSEISFAVRSSATAEDLPTASFAGQQETYLNVQGEDLLIRACHQCFASLYTDRAIKYRIDNGFEHAKVALSVGVQRMVRSDLGCSGVMFTLDPDSGFENVVLISGSYGLGENIVQGNVNSDEWLVFKELAGDVNRPIISRKLGSKELTMVYTPVESWDLRRPESAIQNIETSLEMRQKFVLQDDEIRDLALWGKAIEQHYGCHMDIEWAKDGITNEFFIVQARPETVHSQKGKTRLYTEYELKTKGKVLCKGVGLGNRITSGKARILQSPSEIDLLQADEILVTCRTDPDWDPVLMKAAAIVTDQGGPTSHAAIVAREMGAVAVVGTGNATSSIQTGQWITVNAAEGDSGSVLEGKLEWTEKTTDISNVKLPRTQPMLILGHPSKAFQFAQLPNAGVGLMRMEFIINNAIGIHPMALHHFDKLEDQAVKSEIEAKTHAYPDKKEFFVQRLAEATAVIAAAFYPKDVIVRMSDFKSNEYANLLGGKQFEPNEENPMIGFRGASRYYHPLYREGFEMECKAMKVVREEMGFTNVKLMIPFCRTVDEALKVNQIMDEQGLRRGEKGLERYMMVEIPSNAILATEFAEHFDGFSIGSNDLTQLTLGADRDSELLSEIFSPFDPAVMRLIEMAIQKARAANIKIGLCGQAPSDYPAYAKFLVRCGIDSISFNADALLKGIENIALAESELQPEIIHPMD